MWLYIECYEYAKSKDCVTLNKWPSSWKLPVIAMSDLRISVEQVRLNSSNP